MKKNIIKVLALVFALITVVVCLSACGKETPEGAYTESERDSISAFFPESYTYYTDSNGKNPITIERCTAVGVSSEGSRMFDPVSREGKALEGMYINASGYGVGSIDSDFYGSYGITEDTLQKVSEDEQGMTFVSIEIIDADSNITFVEKDKIYETYASFNDDPYAYMYGTPVGHNILIVEWTTDFDGNVTAYSVSHCMS